MLIALLTNLEMFQFLLKHGANVKEKLFDDTTLLHLVCFMKEGSDAKGIIKLLLESSLNIQEKDDEDETPLHCACINIPGFCSLL